MNEKLMECIKLLQKTENRKGIGRNVKLKGNLGFPAVPRR